MVCRTSPARTVQKLATFIVLMLLATAASAEPGFTLQHRVGYTSGDQWEPALAADGRGHIYILFPNTGGWASV